MALREQIIPRETAEAAPAREVAEDRTFTEAEHLAILTDRVSKETAAKDEEIASLKSKLETLESEKAGLESKLDVEVARAEKAEQDFESYKTAETAKVEAAARLEEREKKVREVATHVKDDFFTDARKQRWAEMAQEDFDGLVSEFAAVAGTPGTGDTAGREAASQTSMSGDVPKPKSGKDFYNLVGGAA